MGGRGIGKTGHDPRMVCLMANCLSAKTAPPINPHKGEFYQDTALQASSDPIPSPEPWLHLHRLPVLRSVPPSLPCRHLSLLQTPLQPPQHPSGTCSPATLPSSGTSHTLVTSQSPCRQAWGPPQSSPVSLFCCLLLVNHTSLEICLFPSSSCFHPSLLSWASIPSQSTVSDVLNRSLYPNLSPLSKDSCC